MNMRPAKKSFWLLIFMKMSPRCGFATGGLWGQRAPARMWVPPTPRYTSLEPDFPRRRQCLSVERRCRAEHFLDRGQAFGDAQRAGQPQRAHAVGNALALERLDAGLPGDLVLEGLADREQLVQAHAAEKARHAAIDAADWPVRMPVAADLPGLHHRLQGGARRFTVGLAALL